AESIVKYWNTDGRKRNPDRTIALATLHVVASIEQAIEAETNAIGSKPLLVATSAREQGVTTYAKLRDQLSSTKGALILFGTGHGLAPSVIESSDVVLEPIRGRG